MGIAHALKHIAPLFVMCDSQDIHVVPQVKAAHNEKPTIFFYDRYPGGIGLSEKIYEGIETVLMREQNKWFQTVHVNKGAHLVLGPILLQRQLNRIVLKITLYYFNPLHTSR